MSYGLWLSAAGMQVNEYRQSVFANNMANVDTVGFKHDLTVVRQRRVESAVDPMQNPYSNRMLDAMTGGAWVRPTYTSFEQGGLDHTGGKFDMAIDGDGFFTVSDGQERRYTRDGRFTMNPDTGELVMVAGGGRFKVQDDNGHPITIADDSLGPIGIAKDGTISQGKGSQRTTIGKLGIVDFDDRTNLRKTGENLFENTGSDKPRPATGRVFGGYVEGSTVDPTRALVNVIEVARAYELNARMLQIQDETMGLAVMRIGRVA